LRNLAAQSIVALEVYATAGARSGRSSVQTVGTPAEPALQPGATYELPIHISQGGRTTPEGFVPDTHQQTVTVGTVIFADGTYEGQARIAAQITARTRGEQLQVARVLPLLQSVIDAPPADAPAALVKLKEQITTLRVDVDAAVLDELCARFPELAGENERKLLTSEVMHGLKQGRSNAERLLEDLERVRAQKPDRFDVQTYMRAAKEQLGKRFGAH
jgi:hypothetical protein